MLEAEILRIVDLHAVYLLGQRVQHIHRARLSRLWDPPFSAREMLGKRLQNGENNTNSLERC